jgi:hypothetical protein
MLRDHVSRLIMDVFLTLVYFIPKLDVVFYFNLIFDISRHFLFATNKFDI